MRIKKLEICGFKSFVERTVLHFDQPVVGIVGPNGCGKSNLVDAIRWVMGEQSAQRLRGKAMEDVIFNGSEQHKPHAFAEVTITFDNRDGDAPAEYREFSEIAVTRRLMRSGDSDYSINKVPARLLDVTHLFLGTGVGRHAYSIIEQGRIGFIVSSRPEDRRQIIEEAAGITKYKVRKKAAEKKMEHTKQNLLRVQDILLEVDKSLASLRRQAEKARRYLEHRAELKDLELHAASHRWLEGSAMQRLVATETVAGEKALAAAQTALQACEIETERRKIAMQMADEAARRTQHHAHMVQQQVLRGDAEITQRSEQIESTKRNQQRMESELVELEQQAQALTAENAAIEQQLVGVQSQHSEAQDALREADLAWQAQRDAAAQAEQSIQRWRAEGSANATELGRRQAERVRWESQHQHALARSEQLATERMALLEQKQPTQQTLTAAASEMQALQKKRDEQQAAQADFANHVATLRTQLVQAEQAIDELRQASHTARSRWRSLQELQERYEGTGAGVRALMTRLAVDEQARQKSGIDRLVADCLDCPPQLTQAVAAALGEALQYVMVESLDDAVRALQFLREQRLGRATLLVRPNLVAEAMSCSAKPRPIDEINFSSPQPLLAMLSIRAEDRAVVTDLLRGVAVVENLDTALLLRRRGEQTETWVTLDGEVLHRNGRLSGGSSEQEGAHRLEAAREMQSLQQLVEQREKLLRNAVTNLAELRQQLEQAQIDAAEAARSLHQLDLTLLAGRKDAQRFEDELQRMEQREQAIERELADLAAQAVQTLASHRQATQELEELQERCAQVDAALASAEEAWQSVRTTVEMHHKALTDHRLRAAELSQQLAAQQGTVGRLRRSLESLDQRRSRLQTDWQQASDGHQSLVQQLAELRQKRSASLSEAQASQQQAEAAQLHYETARSAVEHQEIELRAARHAIEQCNDQLHGQRLRKHELALSLQHLLEQVFERHREDLRSSLLDYHARPALDESMRGRIDELQKLLERLGEVNLLAIEEHAEQTQRRDFLAGQQDDLHVALAQLEEAIQQMNQESKQRFRDTFEAVDRRFRVVFPQMFGGGKAELRLTDPHDMLESGVDIVAQPPGKKLGSLELMSGGEKALTAVSLIFAIFQYKPSPFCLLDEVDAPLDEANIGRFANAVRQMCDRSQFILITHAKGSMEQVDVLYGVTMEQPGVSKLVSVELRKPDDAERYVA